MIDDEPAGIDALIDLMADEDAEVRDRATAGLGSWVDADSEETSSVPRLASLCIDQPRYAASRYRGLDVLLAPA